MTERREDGTVLRQTLIGERRFMLTQEWGTMVGRERVVLKLYSFVPDGMEAVDLGRRFPEARLEGADLLMILDHLARLWSMEWLERAAQEIAQDGDIECDGPEPVEPLILAILKRHRDGA